MKNKKPSRNNAAQKPQTAAKAQADAKPKSFSNVKPDTKAQADGKPKSFSKVKPDTKAHADAKPKFFSKAKTDTKANADTKPKFFSKAKPDTKANDGAKPKTFSKAKADAKAHDGAKPKFFSKTKPDAKVDVKPRRFSKVKPDVKEANVDAKPKYYSKNKPAAKAQAAAKSRSTSSKDGVQLNKYISASGFCSRRQAEQYIEEGRVTINDDIAELTERVQAGDVVAVDGETVKLKIGKQSLYLAFNKPKGITSTTDTSDKSNIIYYINHPKRIFPIGRLDKESEGLILLTNDGDIVNKILRAGNEHEKEYIVVVNKPLSPEFAQQMARGIPILGVKTKPCTVRQLNSKTFKIVLTEGLNRQIRRMCEFLNYEVISLKRIRIMHITLGNLPVGKWRYLSHAETETMNNTLQKSVKTEEASTRVKKKR